MEKLTKLGDDGRSVGQFSITGHTDKLFEG